MNNKNILHGAVLAAALSLTSHANAAGFADCPQFFVGGKPPIVQQRPKLREVCYAAFAILHSGETKTPVFVAQRLNRAAVADADEKRTNRFFEDARLPSAERAKLDDYKGSGYSRGHMAPAGDMPTAQAMAQSFSLANMVPQAGVLSRNRRKFRQPINVACPAPGRWGRPNSRVTSRHFDHGNASRTSRPDCSGLDEAD